MLIILYVCGCLFGLKCLFFFVNDILFFLFLCGIVFVFELLDDRVFGDWDVVFISFGDLG